MTDHLTKLAGISWGHFVRWFVLGRVFRLSTQVRTLVPASLGVLVTIFGWWVLTQLFDNAGDEVFRRKLESYRSCPWTRAGTGALFDGRLSSFGRAIPEMGSPPHDATFDPWSRLSAPVVQLFDLGTTFTGALFLFLATVWAAAVWGYFGGAITRSALWQLTREEPPSIGSVVRHTRKRWLSYFTAPLLPLGGVFLITLGLLFLGLLMRGSILFAGLGWPVALVGGIAMATLMVGLLFGWPLMHATISAEGSDSFDALSRSYSYIFQRPIHYLFYVLAATILGALGLVVVNLFAELVQSLTAWSVSWGSGRDLMLVALSGNTSDLAGHDQLGVKLLAFWSGTVRLVVVGYAFGFFWTAISAIYLLLRHDADGAEISEIYQEESPEAFGLPPVVKDAAGVPTVPPGAGTPEAVKSDEAAKPANEPPPASPNDPGAPPSAS